MRTSHIAIHKRIAEKKGKLMRSSSPLPSMPHILRILRKELPKDITAQAVLKPSTTIPKTLKLLSRIIA